MSTDYCTLKPVPFVGVVLGCPGSPSPVVGPGSGADSAACCRSAASKRAQEALSYNGLVQSWPEIMRLAREVGTAQPAQAQLFEQEPA